jgi:CheY-like chemotaxis protein
VRALRVMLVEDDYLTRLVAGDFLRDEGFEVEEASSGDEAALRLGGPELFDVLFTDVQMPGKMDGWHHVATHARGFHPAIILVVVSGFAPLIHDRLQDFDPAAVFLPKPYQMPKIVETIRRLAA